MIKILKQYWQSILWFSLILYGSFTPQDSLDPRFYFFENQDKVIHGIFYLVLLVVFLRNYSNTSKPTTRNIIAILLLCCSISLCIEFLQPILSNRTNDIMDFASNSLGGIIGIGVFKILDTKKGNL